MHRKALSHNHRLNLISHLPTSGSNHKMTAYSQAAMPIASDSQRPIMRRKSSAQNLLSSFKPPQTATVPPLAGLPTPTVSTPMAREWDVQSLTSDSVTLASSGLPNGSGTTTPQGTSVEMLRELVRKRIITLTYLRNVHEGSA